MGRGRSPSPSERDPLLSLGTPATTKAPASQRRAARLPGLTVGLAAVLLLLGCIWALVELDKTSPHGLSNELLGLVEDAHDWFINGSQEGPTKCSGHGVLVRGGRCLCDLGYAGDTCHERRDLTKTSATEPAKRTVCLFVDQAERDAATGRHNLLELAQSLSGAGYAVTVVPLGAADAAVKALSVTLAADAVVVKRLPSTGVGFGERALEERAYDVYQFLAHAPRAFEHVVFSAASGAGYYTLLAQSQGLLASGSNFVVTVDSFPRAYHHAQDPADKDSFVADVDALKLDFMQQKSAELADQVIFASSSLQEFAAHQGWKVSKAKQRVIAHIPATASSAPTHHNSSAIDELVFVGELSSAGGLRTFCDAVDTLVSDFGVRGLRLTLVGRPGSIFGFPADEYVELRAANWDRAEVDWRIVRENDPLAAAAYLSGPAASGRLAVLPGAGSGDAAGAALQALVHVGAPFIAASAGPLRDLVTASDVPRVAMEPQGSEIAKRIVEVVAGLADGWTPVRPKFTRDAVGAHWKQTLQSAKPKQYVDPLKDKRPLVSIVLVHHNRHQLLRQAIEAIEAQTYRNFEVVLVDDGSTDPESRRFVEDLSWRWWRSRGWKVLLEPNRYLGAARNTGARHARGDYLLFLDDDDYSKPHQIETMLRAALATDADVVTAGHDLFGGLARPVNAARSARRYLPLGSAPAAGVMENIFGDAALLARRGFFVELGGFSEDRGVGFEDYEFLAKVALAQATGSGRGSLQAVPEPLHWYRQHARSMSRRTNLKENQLRLLRPYANAERDLPPQLRFLLMHARKVFFDTHGVSFDEAFVRRGYQSNTTTTTSPTPTPTIACPAFVDQSGGSAIQIGLSEIWANKAKALCWNAGKQSAGALSGNNIKTLPVLLPIYSDYTQAGLPVVSALPCTQASYSDAWAVTKVIVPDSVQFNYYKDYDILSKAVTYGTFSGGVVNRPIVPPMSSVSNTLNLKISTPTFGQAWFQNQSVTYVDLGTVDGASGSVTLDNEVLVLKNGAGFGFPVTDASPGSGSGFYALSSVDVSDYDYYVENTFQSVSGIPSTFAVTPMKTVENCPVAYVDTSFKPSGLSLSGIDPPVIPKLPGIEVTLQGTNFDPTVIVYVEGQALPPNYVTVLSSSAIQVILDATSFAGNNGSVHIGVNNTMPFLLSYYSADAEVFSVTTGALLTNKANQMITIAATGLVEFGKGVCVFNTTSKGVSTPMAVSGPFTASCALPSIAASGYYSVSFALSVRTSAPSLYDSIFLPVANSALSPSGVVLRVYSPAPAVYAAKFSDAGSAILITLDRAAALAASANASVQSFGLSGGAAAADAAMPCSAVFASQPDAAAANTSTSTSVVAASLLYRETSPDDCVLQQVSPTQLRLTLAAQFAAFNGSAIVPDGVVQALAGALVADGEALTLAASSSAAVSAPDSPPAPLVVAVAPAHLPVCADLEIDLSASYGSVGRLFSADGSLVAFTSSSVVPASSEIHKTLQQALDVALQGFISGAAPTMVVPASAFWLPEDPAATYETFAITVTLRNFLGAAASDVVEVHRYRDNSVPLVVVQGAANVNAHAGRPQELIAAGRQSCNVSVPIEYRWSVGSEGCGSFAAVNISSSNVVIHPYSVGPATECSLELEYKYDNETDWLRSSKLVSMATDTIIASAGPSRTVGLGQQLVADAIIFDDAYASIDAALFSCTWTCTFNGLPCVPAVKSQLSDCFDNDLTSFVDVGTYSLGLTVVNTHTGATASAAFPTNITVVAANVPLVALSLNQGQPSAFSEQFAIHADVDAASTSTAPENLVYNWSSCANDANGAIDFSNPKLFQVDLADAHLRTIKFVPGALLASASYCVAVTATDPATGAVGESSVAFSTLDMPSGGFCELQATSVAASAPLHYSCPLWVTDAASLPLTYQFMVRQSAADPWTQVGVGSVSPYLNVGLASGAYQIQAVVTDAAGSRVQGVSSAFSVVAPADNGSDALARRDDASTSNSTTETCTSALCGYVAAARQDFAITGNALTAARALAVSALQANASVPELPGVLEFASVVVGGGMLLDTTSNGPFVASLLQAVVGDAYALVGADAAPLAAVLRAAAEGIHTVGGWSNPPSCVASDVSQAYYQVVDQLLGSLAAGPAAADASDADRATAMTGVEAAIANFAACAARLKQPQEFPSVFNASYFSRTVGVAATNQTTFCDAVALASGVGATGSAYSCGTAPARDFPLGNLTAVAAAALDATFFGAAQSTVAANVSVQLQPAFFAAANVSITDTAADGLGAYVAVATDGGNTTVRCVAYDTAADAWSATAGSCQLVQLSADIGVCACAALAPGQPVTVAAETRSAGAISPTEPSVASTVATTGAPGATTTSGGGGSGTPLGDAGAKAVLSGGAIAGIAVAAVVAVVAAVGAAVMMRRRAAAKAAAAAGGRAAAGALLPFTTAEAAAISVAAGSGVGAAPTAEAASVAAVVAVAGAVAQRQQQQKQQRNRPAPRARPKYARPPSYEEHLRRASAAAGRRQ